MIVVVTTDLDRLFAALADPRRRRVVELLRDGPRRAGDLAEASQTSAPVMSRHLRVLMSAGLIDDERSPVDARVRLFFLRHEALADMQSWLADETRLSAEDLELFQP